MSDPTTKRDPRTIVTPDAFRVSADLLGLQLASPGRRLAAILIDLVGIGILTLITRNFMLVLAVVVAIALVRESVRRSRLPGDAVDRVRRIAIGCLGLAVGGVTLMVAVIIALERTNAVSTEFNEDSTAVTINVGARQLTLGTPDTTRSTGEPVDSPAAQSAREGVSLYTLEQALERYIALRREDGLDPGDRALVAALEERFAQEFSSDTLRALDDRVEELEREVRSVQEELDDAVAELDRTVSGGVVGWLRGTLDEVGFGFGWAALYMTVLLSMTNGQTLGKKLLGIRVLRLDGQRLNWWMAFERSGGYAAGFATGLLGFAQIFWDANRQAIHDRIMRTVVVREGAPRIEDWESAL